jgi:putative copper resistance protein D
VAWGISEVPTILLAMLVALSWVRSDAAETRRKDRQADRDDDAELKAYNAYLAAAAARDRKTTTSPGE